MAKPDRFAVVTCPIARDNTVNIDGVAVTVFVKSGYDHRVACSLFSYSLFGDQLARNTRVAAEEGKTAFHPEVGISEDSGYYLLLFNLRDGYAIYTYRVDEYLDTDADY